MKLVSRSGSPSPISPSEAGLQQGVVGSKVYYGADSRIAQHDGTVSLTSVYARKDFRFGGFHLDNRVLLQWSTNQEVVPVPLLGAYLSYYYEFWVVRDVLRLQIGLDGRYHTRYRAPSYNPALSAFYNQREVEVGNYPYVDAFAMAKWKRMRIFLEVSACQQGFVRQRRRVFLRRQLSAQSRHVQDRHLVGFL